MILLTLLLLAAPPREIATVAHQADAAQREANLHAWMARTPPEIAAEQRWERERFGAKGSGR